MVFKYDNNEEKRKKSYQLFSFLQILFFTLLTSIPINEFITMFGYSVQSSQINSSSVWCFLYIKFWHFEHFVFNLLFRFSLSTHWMHLPDVWLKCSGWWWADTSLLITVIFNTFDWLYLLLIAGKTNFSQGHKSFQCLLVWIRCLAKWF